jgi:hypothetical protein
MGLFDKLFSGKEEENKGADKKKGPRLFTSPQQAQSAGAAPPAQAPAPGGTRPSGKRAAAGGTSAAPKPAPGKEPAKAPPAKTASSPAGKTKAPAPKPAPKPASDATETVAPSGDTVNMPRAKRTTPPQSPPVKHPAGVTEPPHARSVSSRRSWRKRTSTKSRQLGQLLLRLETIQQKHLDEALDEQQRSGGLLGQILVRLGHCDKADVGRALARQRTITTIDLDDVVFEKEALAMLPRELCEEQRVIPFEKMGNLLCVAMTNVLDATTKTRVRETAKMQIKTFDAAWDQILEQIRKQYPEEAAPSAPAAPAAAAPSAPAPAGAEEAPAGKEEEATEDFVIELPEEEELASGADGSKTDETDGSRTQG